MQLENDSLHYNHDLGAKLVQVMNTKVVPCAILNMFKVLLRSHKHFTRWSHVNPSLDINLRGITCDISKVVKIEFDMLMLMNAQWCLCSCNANAKCMLNTRVLQPLPPIEISPQDWKDLPILVESGVGITQKIIPFPRCILLTMVVPHHLIELKHLTSSHSLHFFYHPNRFVFICQIRLDLDISGFNGFFGHTKTFFQLRDMENIEDGAHL